MRTKLILSTFLLISTFSLKSYGQTNWTKYNNNPVLVKGPDNFDLIAIGQPTILFENDTIKMWYAGVGTDMKSRICFAYSTDGINWIKHNQPVINVGNSGTWDCGWLDTPEIVKDNTGYKLYYYGDTVQQFSGISSAIGVAFSTDGINWTKYSGNPIFTKGNIGDWDGTWVESPAINFDSNTGEYKMWYNGVDTATWKINIGLATSNDGINWTKYANNPVVTTGNWGTYDDMWLGTPTILKIDNYYEMWYAATASNSYNYSTSSFDTVSICYTTSIDGISWTKHFNNPLFNTYTLPYDSLVDRGGPWAPCVIYNHNTNNYMMWYEAHGGNANYTFSLATAPRTNTSITENNQTDYNVFPNPMSSSATIRTIKIFENATLQMFNSIGQCVLLIERVNGKEIEINKGNLKSGVYLLLIRNAENNLTTKLLIE